MVSIKDVAKHAGVAISTVSKVLNHYPNISEATRIKVNKAVEELNFVPNSVASALSSKQSGRVALMVNLNVKTQAVDEIAMRYISGALTKAMELNLDVITLFVFMFQNRTVEELIRYLQSQSITGIIIYGLAKDDHILQELIASEQFKCVVVDAPHLGEGISSVSIDHRKAQYEVAKKTIEEYPCRKILYITGDRYGYVTEERMEGMEQLVQEMGLEMTAQYADFTELKAREIALKYGKEAEAIICASDLMAIGAMNALEDLGVKRPVCGFDGIVLMGYLSQSINTICQSFSQISAIAMEELHRLLDGEQGRKVQVEYSLKKIKYTDIIC